MILVNSHKRLSKLLIIFDLDDTLVQTSATLIPEKLKLGLQSVKTIDTHLFAELLRMDTMSLSSECALEEFSELYAINSDQLKILQRVIRKPALDGIDIEPVERVNEVLQTLSERHFLCLVSRGEEGYQKEKLKHAGIDENVFSQLIFCQGGKKESYQKLFKRYARLESEVIVCGDRIGFDLSPAKALGFQTIHLAQGRGSVSLDYFSDVDYKIIHLVEIFDIIEEIERKQYLRSL